MTKLSFKRLIAGLFMALATLLPSAAMAQVCGVTGLASTGSSALIYDPFNPGQTTTGTNAITMTISRVNQQGGERTELLNFYLTSINSDVPGVQIIPKTVSGGASITGTGLNQNIFHNFPSGPSLPSVSNPIPNNTGGYMTISYGSNSPQVGDTAAVTFDVILPPNLNFLASTQLSFRAVFSCRFKGIGNAPPSWTNGIREDAIVFPVTVLSALQASYVGSALDFGEVGDKTTTEVQATPNAYTRTGNIRVASSGAYSVSMTSDNNYRLKFPGGNAATPAQSLAYSASLVGETRTGISGGAIAGQVPITKICTRAGVGGTFLPVEVVLKEGGSTKTPAPLYNDFLNVTVTPLVAAVGASACP